MGDRDLVMAALHDVVHGPPPCTDDCGSDGTPEQRGCDSCDMREGWGEDELLHIVQSHGLLIVSRARLTRVLRKLWRRGDWAKGEHRRLIDRWTAALKFVPELERELAEARSILSEAVGHNDEPHETLADCARLLVLDCNAEHERALQAESELAALKARDCESCRRFHQEDGYGGYCDRGVQSQRGTGFIKVPWHCAYWAQKGDER